MSKQKKSEVDKYLLKQARRVWAFFKKLPKTWEYADSHYTLQVTEAPGIWHEFNKHEDNLITIELRRVSPDVETIVYFQSPADNFDMVEPYSITRLYQKIHDHTPFEPKDKFFDTYNEVYKIFDACDRYPIV